jgi:hypothetical protein
MSKGITGANVIDKKLLDFALFKELNHDSDDMRVTIWLVKPGATNQE